MSRKLVTWITTGATLLMAFASPAIAANFSAAALTGKVSSQAEGPMEGVILGAKKVGSTITTWVVSNAQGRYTFPRERLQPGRYAITARAAGYELPKTSIEVSEQAAQLDLQLNKVTSKSKLAMQRRSSTLTASNNPSLRKHSVVTLCRKIRTMNPLRFCLREFGGLVEPRIVPREDENVGENPLFLLR